MSLAATKSFATWTWNRLGAWRVYPRLRLGKSWSMCQMLQRERAGKGLGYPSFTWFPAAAAAKSLQSCPTLWDPIDGSLPGFTIPGILQATMEWVAISFSNAWQWKVKVKLLSRVQLFETPWTAAYQASPSMGFSRQEYWSGVPLPDSLVILKSWGSKPILRADARASSPPKTRNSPSLVCLPPAPISLLPEGSFWACVVSGCPCVAHHYTAFLTLLNIPGTAVWERRAIGWRHIQSLGAQLLNHLKLNRLLTSLCIRA